MAHFTELLGEELLGQSGEKLSTVTALAGKYVGLYFSAHWCPPCRGFTPVLAKAYKEFLQAKGLEIVFVSSDKDQGSFDGYFGEMPWKALPFSDRDRKNQLSKKYKVNGIPTFVLLDIDGKVITTDARSEVDEDPEGKQFPWKPLPLHEVLGTKFVKAGGAEVDASAISGKVLGLYFSAHWCPPCRMFTPQLAKWYSNLKANKKDLPFEIVFVSSDRDQQSFDEYLGEMPWLALPHADRSAAGKLDKLFGIEGIPMFIIVDAEGRTITKNGRGIPKSDPEGDGFPWHPKAVKDLAEDASSINESTSLVVLAEGADAAALEGIRGALEPLAKKFNEEARASGGDPALVFFVGTGGPSSQIRQLCSLPAIVAPHEHETKLHEGGSGWNCDGCHGRGSGDRYRCTAGCDFDFCADCHRAAQQFAPAAPVAVILDIPDNGGYYLNPSEGVGAEQIQTFVDRFLAKSLERKQLGE